jgi:hypothetical protein
VLQDWEKPVVPRQTLGDVIHGVELDQGTQRSAMMARGEIGRLRDREG